MIRNRILHIVRAACSLQRRALIVKCNSLAPVALGFITVGYCSEKQKEIDLDWDASSLEHDFLIRQATTVNVNAATQLLTVTLVAIQDTSERLREHLSKEICLVRQAMEWGEDSTPPQHWDELVAVRGALCDLKHNLRVLFSYMDYAEKLATTAAEISYLSGNVAASDAICERIDHVCRQPPFFRACNTQKQLTHELQQESLELQQKAIITSPALEDKIKEKPTEQDRHPKINSTS